MPSRPSSRQVCKLKSLQNNASMNSIMHITLNVTSDDDYYSTIVCVGVHAVHSQLASHTLVLGLPTWYNVQ